LFSYSPTCLAQQALIFVNVYQYIDFITYL